jgi:hypothetical protein
MNKVDESNRISSPTSGSVVIHSGWQPSKHLRGYPRLVYIVNGKLWGTYGLSNFWTWRPVLKNGNLGKEVHGYGSFYKSPDVYELKIIIIKK